MFGFEIIQPNITILLSQSIARFLVLLWRISTHTFFVYVYVCVVYAIAQPCVVVNIPMMYDGYELVKFTVTFYCVYTTQGS